MSLSHADHAIALMSGNFLQRGSIALWDKYTRAEMAVADGFDLCLELPFVYATGSAGDFADGAVAILKNLHAIDYLAFGVEEAEPDVFEQVAEVLTEEPENYQLALKQALKVGVSYPRARQTAIAAICGDSAAALLKAPNNTNGFQMTITIPIYRHRSARQLPSGQPLRKERTFQHLPHRFHRQPICAWRHPTTPICRMQC